jgi:hypothetical protein
MPARPDAFIPTYRRHKPTGKGVVTLDGRDIYLGIHGRMPAESDTTASLHSGWPMVAACRPNPTDS